jgi:ribosomal protein L29
MKIRQLRGLGKSEREKKLKELKLELTKARAAATKGGSSRIKQIKKIMARIYTINNSNKTEGLNKK